MRAVISFMIQAPVYFPTNVGLVMGQKVQLIFSGVSVTNEKKTVLQIDNRRPRT